MVAVSFKIKKKTALGPGPLAGWPLPATIPISPCDVVRFFCGLSDLSIVNHRSRVYFCRIVLCLCQV